MSLQVKDLQVLVKGKEILKGVDLEIKAGEVVVIMGPNGSGKSSLAHTLMGQEKYRVKKGKMQLDGQDLLKMKTDERVKAGLFLSWQNPVTIEGVTVEQVLRAAMISCKNSACKRTGQLEECLTVGEFREVLYKQAKKLDINKKLLSRSINAGFSGGEKKKIEILQMVLLKPKYAILDEVDSGLDIDALRIIGGNINRLRRNNALMGIVLITHYQRILKEIKPDKVMIMKKGKIVKSGGRRLVEIIEKKGYEKI